VRGDTFLEVPRTSRVVAIKGSKNPDSLFWIGLRVDFRGFVIHNVG
jgi:hypothetical protein